MGVSAGTRGSGGTEASPSDLRGGFGALLGDDGGREASSRTEAITLVNGEEIEEPKGRLCIPPVHDPE